MDTTPDQPEVMGPPMITSQMEQGSISGSVNGSVTESNKRRRTDKEGEGVKKKSSKAQSVDPYKQAADTIKRYDKLVENYEYQVLRFVECAQEIEDRKISLLLGMLEAEESSESPNEPDADVEMMDASLSAQIISFGFIRQRYASTLTRDFPPEFTDTQWTDPMVSTLQFTALLKRLPEVLNDLIVKLFTIKEEISGARQELKQAGPKKPLPVPSEFAKPNVWPHFQMTKSGFLVCRPSSKAGTPMWMLDPAFETFREALKAPMPSLDAMDPHHILADSLATQLSNSMGEIFSTADPLPETPADAPLPLGIQPKYAPDLDAAIATGHAKRHNLWKAVLTKYLGLEYTKELVVNFLGKPMGKFDFALVDAISKYLAGEIKVEITDGVFPLMQLARAYHYLVNSDQKPILPGSPMFFLGVTGAELTIYGGFYDGDNIIIEPLAMEFMIRDQYGSLVPPLTHALYALTLGIKSLMRRSEAFQTQTAAAQALEAEFAPGCPRVFKIFQRINLTQKSANVNASKADSTPADVNADSTSKSTNVSAIKADSTSKSTNVNAIKADSTSDDINTIKPGPTSAVNFSINFIKPCFYVGREEQLIYKAVSQSIATRFVIVECPKFGRYGMDLQMKLSGLKPKLAPSLYSKCQRPTGTAYVLEHLKPPTNVKEGWLTLYELARVSKAEAITHSEAIKRGLYLILKTLQEPMSETDSRFSVHSDLRSHNIAISMLNTREIGLKGGEVSLRLLNFHNAGYVNEAVHVSHLSPIWPGKGGAYITCQDDTDMLEKWIHAYPTLMNPAQVIWRVRMQSFGGSALAARLSDSCLAPVANTRAPATLAAITKHGNRPCVFLGTHVPSLASDVRHRRLPSLYPATLATWLQVLTRRVMYSGSWTHGAPALLLALRAESDSLFALNWRPLSVQDMPLQLQSAFKYLLSSPNPYVQKYRLASKINTQQGPINCFTIIGDGELLASGGDDETVKIWDLVTYERRATLADKARKWGQITCLLWIGLDNHISGSDLLCFGTGRGRMVLYKRQRKRDRFIEISDVQVFSCGDCMETITFDPVHFRIIATSHNGKIKMFRLDKDEISPVWTVDLSEAIPRSAHFINRGEDVVIYALETGEISCRDAQTAALKNSRVIKSAIGNVDVDGAQKNIVIDNITNGFDVYPIHRSTPIHSFEVPTTHQYVRMAVFGENGSVVVGGSDHGKVYIFDLKAPGITSTIMHGSPTSLIQAVATASLDDRHLIISGSSDDDSSICVHEKMTKRALLRRQREDERRGIKVLVYIGLIFVAMLVITCQAWFPVFYQEMLTIVVGLNAALPQSPFPKYR
ncbi:hypothetical protein GALMADRAFT_139563 [Galerina marginata CBS 339.88]|uniref:Uncharacterized protein n=1 Tax=Galerina marginata (strain CBS 339.88) TaxID=685588 RepID=A0A067T2U6_GALM3|nr:hypothetical protein GALMADRAFT_139563 [Galerina marginata CBS 339.88]